MSFVKLGEKTYNTDQIIIIEDYKQEGITVHLLNGTNAFINISQEEALKALGPSLIEVGKIFIDPDEVLAVSHFIDDQGCVVEDKSMIWLGPSVEDYFNVPVSVEEAVHLINKG